MDNVAVHIAERMHYQGLVEIDLSKQLEQLKQKKLENEMHAKLEDEVMEEYASFILILSFKSYLLILGI
jgi:DNA-directed RNA polymerase subunit E'/Rpb7